MFESMTMPGRKDGEIRKGREDRKIDGKSFQASEELSCRVRKPMGAIFGTHIFPSRLH